MSLIGKKRLFFLSNTYALCTLPVRTMFNKHLVFKGWNILKVSFAWEIFICKKKNESTAQRILLSGLNMGNKKGLRESKQQSCQVCLHNAGLILFFLTCVVGRGEGKRTAPVPASVPVLRGRRDHCWDVVALCRLCDIHRI